MDTRGGRLGAGREEDIDHERALHALNAVFGNQLDFTAFLGLDTHDEIGGLVLEGHGIGFSRGNFNDIGLGRILDDDLDVELVSKSHAARARLEYLYDGSEIGKVHALRLNHRPLRDQLDWRVDRGRNERVARRRRLDQGEVGVGDVGLVARNMGEADAVVCAGLGLARAVQAGLPAKGSLGHADAAGDLADLVGADHQVDGDRARQVA
jgi:hypothetical protein